MNHPLVGEAVRQWLTKCPPDSVVCTTVFPSSISQLGMTFVERFEDASRRQNTRVSVCGTDFGAAGFHVVLPVVPALIDAVSQLPDGLLSFTHPAMPEDAVVVCGGVMVLSAIAHEKKIYYDPKISPGIRLPTASQRQR